MAEPVVIIGGGISGLSVAYRLQEHSIPFQLYEAGSSFGGNIQTYQKGDSLFDLGPDAFLKTKPAAAALCREVGLGDQLISPPARGRRVYVGKNRQLIPFPQGLSLGVPVRPRALFSTPLLSWRGKLRACLEPLVPRRSGGEESIAQFFRRRLGVEMATVLTTPLLSGVYAGDAETLSVDACFPQFVEMEQKHGSLLSALSGGKKGLRLLRHLLTARPKAQESPFLSLRRGLGQLVDELVHRLPSEKLHLSTKVKGIKREGDSFLIDVDGTSLRAQQVVLALPPWSAARLLSDSFPEAALALSGIRGRPTATVHFSFPREKLPRDLDGSGFIVPPGEGNILAATFVSSKWDGRALQDEALIRCFVGGARVDISSKTDQEIVEIAESELQHWLGRGGAPSWTHVFRYEKGTPQPELGHLAKLDIVEKSLAECPGLHLLGSGYRSVGIPDCIAQAERVAAMILDTESNASQ
ncbi:MAG: protoporphyrinogen oxidase [Polyangiaceae bacterium]|nr:protoporphyrinogen oxidase [Polyangiaceae bacterium]